MIVIEDINRCTFMDALKPQKPAPVRNARQVINMSADPRTVHIDPQEEIRLRRLYQNTYRGLA